MNKFIVERNNNLFLEQKISQTFDQFGFFSKILDKSLSPNVHQLLNTRSFKRPQEEGGSVPLPERPNAGYRLTFDRITCS